MIKTAILVGALFVVTGLQAQTIKSEESEVRFEIGNMWLNSVEGTFTGMAGDVVFNPALPEEAKFSVCVDAASVNTSNKKRDEHLRKEDFFHVSKYPKICFESTKVMQAESGYEITGNLTMHGVTKTISFPFTRSKNMLTGTFTINRVDYEVGAKTGSFMVAEEVEVTIVAVM